MKINFNNRIGRRVLSFALAGTLVTVSIAMVERTMDDESNAVQNELACGHYYDEDVKKIDK